MRPFHRFALAFSTTFVLTGLPSLLHADWHGNVNGMLGAKRLEKRWEPIDSQPSIGVMSDFRQGEWPLSLALDLFYSGDEGTAKGVSLDGSTVEANIGLRKIFRATRAMRPYVGVGWSFV